MRLILTTIILTMLAQPVWAQTVYYCSINVVAKIDSEEMITYKNERFKMSVSAEEIKFESKGYLLRKKVLKPNFFGGDTYFTAQDSTVDGRILAQFYAPNFSYSRVDANEVISFTATCEKF